MLQDGIGVDSWLLGSVEFLTSVVVENRIDVEAKISTLVFLLLLPV